MPKKISMAAALGLASVMLAPATATAMSLQFSWEGYARCTKGSPAFTLGDVPAGTTRLSFKLTDLKVPNYPHGGGTVAYQDGTTVIGAGAVSAQGPCPPEGERHDYQWTVQALDGAGKVLASASAVRKFPPR
jgi:phosphatidylethanolamine-binding protein (PEBP) family uncharacterized protein